jgi:hypothetical protein
MGLEMQKTGPRLPQVQFVVDQFPSILFVDQNSGFWIHKKATPVSHIHLLLQEARKNIRTHGS